MTFGELSQSCSASILERFQDYQDRFRQITQRAPQHFLQRQWAQVQADTTERLGLYAGAVGRAETDILRLLEAGVTDERTWASAKIDFGGRIVDRDDRDLAETFFNSVTRRVFDTVGVNRRIEFVRDDQEAFRPEPSQAVFRTYRWSGDFERVIGRIFSDFNDIRIGGPALDSALPQIVKRVQHRLDEKHDPTGPVHIEMIRQVFFRGQGAYLIGRIRQGKRLIPIVMALLHPPSGVVVDALVLDTDAASIVFSYTRSAFHVDVALLPALIHFLKSILPAKPSADIYSAIGYFKHGKTVLYRDVCLHTRQCTDERFRISPGKPGMIMAVFDMAGHDMVIKLIRDRFENPKKTSRGKVMALYDFVFSHYRVGRLIAAHAFEHLSFDRCWFSDELLDHLTTVAGRTVRLKNDRVIIEHAYLERRVTPLDIYLQQETGDKAEAVVVDLGNAIKDLAFANIFPGDLLLKNFGVTRHGRVVFYDYDEIVPLTDCRFRKIPPARTDMEEMSAEPWYMIGENDVFPEEFSRFLGLSPRHRDLFIRHHADLFSPAFWTTAQAEIRSGHMRHIRPYHPRYRLEEPV